MRAMISSVLILIVCGAVPALAQLPPEIQADLYLLRAEQAIGEGNQTRARSEIDKIVLLEKEHELDLPEEFHFRYAKAADLANMPDEALESAVKYLTAAGREGQHYVEALALMNKVQDVIEGRTEPQVVPPGQSPPMQAASQKTVEVAPEVAGTTEGQKEQEVPVAGAETTESPQLPRCEQWNTEEYFQKATVDQITACLDTGANPKAVNKDKITPLHFAAGISENPAVIEALLAAGADPKALDKGTQTPLHLAAWANENPAVLEALLAAGADVDTLGKNGYTPMMYAAFNNENPAVIEALLAAGANPNAKTDDGHMALHLAAENNENPAVIETLLAAGANPNVKAGNGSTPLHLAAWDNENPAVIEALLAAGADPTVRGFLGFTPLHGAASYNDNPAVIAVLLAAGADPMARDDVGDTPLKQAAIENTNPAVLEALLEAVENLNAKIDQGLTLLHWAARVNKNPAVIEALLAAGADPMVRGEDGSTPLHHAAEINDNPAVIAVLLAAGADPMARDVGGRTPLHQAAENTSADEHEHPAVGVIEALLAAGANLESRDQGGNTPLHRAASFSLLPWDAGVAIEELLDAGADPTARNNNGKTPWDLAQANEKLQGSDGYWRLNDARFQGGQRGELSPLPTSQTPASNAAVSAGTGSCEVPGYPSPPGGVANLGFSWCPASISMQARAFALQAAGAQCAIAIGSSSTPEQIQARRREISAACARLAALGAPNCQCPPGLGGPGSTQDFSSIQQEKKPRAQWATQQEEARQTALAEKRRIEAVNVEVLNSNCSCIGIDDKTGEYSCLDGFVMGNNSSGKPLCDIKR